MRRTGPEPNHCAAAHINLIYLFLFPFLFFLIWQRRCRSFFIVFIRLTECPFTSPTECSYISHCSAHKLEKKRQITSFGAQAGEGSIRPVCRGIPDAVPVIQATGQFVLPRPPPLRPPAPHHFPSPSQTFLWLVAQVITPSHSIHHSISLIFPNLPAQSEVRITFSPVFHQSLSPPLLIPLRLHSSFFFSFSSRHLLLHGIIFASCFLNPPSSPLLSSPLRRHLSSHSACLRQQTCGGHLQIALHLFLLFSSVRSFHFHIQLFGIFSPLLLCLALQEALGSSAFSPAY